MAKGNEARLFMKIETKDINYIGDSTNVKLKRTILIRYGDKIRKSIKKDKSLFILDCNLNRK